MKTILPLLFSLSLLAASPLTAGPEIKSLAAFPQQAVNINTWMKQNGWESKRHNPKRFEVGGGRLRLVSNKDSVQIGTNRGFPLDPRKYSKIRFTIWIDKNPAGTNPSTKAGDDSAFRLYLAFDRSGGIFSPPNSIAYSWTEKKQAVETSVSPHYKSVRNLYIGHGLTLPAKGGGDKPVFVTIERDVLADYKKCFPEDSRGVPMLAGVMVKCDTNNTGTTAESWLSKLELEASKAGGR